VVVVTCPTTVVHDEAFDSQACSFVRKSELVLLRSNQSESLPRSCRESGVFSSLICLQVFLAFELVENTRGASISHGPYTLQKNGGVVSVSPADR